MMMTLSKYRSAIMLFFVMFVYILVINGLPFGQGESKLVLYKSIDKIMEAGPYRIEGEGILILQNQNMPTIHDGLSIYFGLDGYMDFEKKDHEIRISLRDAFGYEDIPLGSYRGLGDTHQIFSEIGIRETIDIHSFFLQDPSTKATRDRLWQSVQKDVEVSRSWIADTQNGYNPIKREVTTFEMDLGVLLTQGMIEELSSLLMAPLKIDAALLSYQTDRSGTPLGLNLDINTQQIDLEISIEISKLM
jgi:hypothetical protein